MAIVDRVRDLVAPAVADVGAELYDVEFHGGVLRVFIDAENGVEVSQIQQVSRAVGRILDEADPIPGRYTLEVSSPGLERSLRTEAHYRSAIGTDVKLKLGPQVDGDRRVTGTLRAVDAQSVELEVDGALRRVPLADITKARTVFEWGPAPKPGKRPARQPDSQNDSQREATQP